MACGYLMAYVSFVVLEAITIRNVHHSVEQWSSAKTTCCGVSKSTNG